MLRLLALVLVGAGLVVGIVIGVVGFNHSHAEGSTQTHVTLTRQADGGYQLDWSLNAGMGVLIRLEQPNGRCSIYVDEAVGKKTWRIAPGIGVWSQLGVRDELASGMNEATRDCSSISVFQSLPKGV